MHSPNLAIFGGSFNPIHQGHLHLAKQIQTTFNFAQFIFLPCKSHRLKKKPDISDQHRLKMIEIALEAEGLNNHFKLDQREILSNSSLSYTVNTLENFRQEYGDKTALTFILGYDAFLQFNQWKEWENILSLANLLIIERKEYQQNNLPPILQQLTMQHAAKKKTDLLSTSHGLIYFYNAGEYAISSTGIRQAMHQSTGEITKLIPTQVYQYIKANKLYQGSD